MTDHLPTPDQTAAPAAPEGAAAPALPENASASAADTHRPAGASNRGGRGGRGRGRKPGGGDQAAPADAHAPADATAAPRRAPRAIPPALEQLAALYPQLFGAVFLPLKRGIFQDLLSAHPEAFEREALKLALGIHTRSTRYLQCVAAGQQRHDLQGQPVEAMAPEHIHQALLEVHRRRQGRSTEDLLPKLRARIVANIEASGLSREEYAERVRTRDAAANALLDEALAELSAKIAREEALQRTFEASGKSVDEFADMYGMDPRAVARSLHNARSRAAAEAAAAAAAAAVEPEVAADPIEPHPAPDAA
ncbi:ProQ/FINO family protein [Simplicispira psychrophila]|uniref:ProQ/FINO family protein n=1 Tax=Simplicispira psychrophila TaxID=80882 RepID=UPI001FDECD1E|nr:ProQ/FINO family protein [Simplicispira psychrophila]